MKWILAMCLSFVGVAFANSEKDAPILYYSDDCSVNILPNAGPSIRRDWNVFLTADFIYWTLKQDGMAHAISRTLESDTLASGKLLEMDWTSEPGFKVGLGMNLPHDGWDLVAQYTWITTNVSDSITGSDTTQVIPYWLTSPDGGFFAPVSKADQSWNAHYNNLTLDLGRNTYMSQYMKLRLFAGLQAAWISQEAKAEYTSEGSPAKEVVDLSQDFYGFGLHAGLNNSFHITKSLSFFADTALSVLWGKFDLDRKYTPSEEGESGFKLDNDRHTAQPVVNIESGVRYDLWFSENRYHVAIQAGWEHTVWMFHNQLIKLPTEADHSGNLYLQGLTFKARFDF